MKMESKILKILRNIRLPQTMPPPKGRESTPLKSFRLLKSLLLRKNPKISLKEKTQILVKATRPRIPNPLKNPRTPIKQPKATFTSPKTERVPQL
jgi:hypothetical protein